MTDETISLGQIHGVGFQAARNPDMAAKLQRDVVEKSWGVRNRQFVLDCRSGKERDLTISCFRCWRLDALRGQQVSDKWEDYARLNFLRVEESKEPVFIDGKVKREMRVTSKNYVFVCGVCGGGCAVCVEV